MYRPIIAICDVGQGSAMLLTYKSIQVIIDVGPSVNKLHQCLDKYVYKNDKTLELIIITHADVDHYGSLHRLADSYQINTILGSKQTVKDDSIMSMGLNSTEIGDRDEVYFEDFKLKVYFPEEEICKHEQDKNLCSLIIYVCIKDFCGLNTGDLPMKNLSKIEDVVFDKSSWITIPHHGSSTGWSTDVWAMFVNLKDVYISVGNSNRYGHPSEIVLYDINNKHSVRIFRTDIHGSALVK